MAISKSTPYVRYKKDFTSSLHLGTIHVESEYLDRTQKTTIESIHGMTWHNKVVNENKELNLLSDTQLELTELEKQYWNTGEKRVSVDEIHTLEEVEPNEDGTYTYTVNSMEGEYIEIYDGINNITSTSDGLDGQFEIVYDTTEEDINGNIALDSIVPQYEITDSGVGAITGAKSTGLTLVNHITESSKEEVVAIQEYEGQYFTIENTVEGNIKSAILKGNTLVNLVVNSSVEKNVGNSSSTEAIYDYIYQLEKNKEYTIQFEISNFNATQPMSCSFDNGWSGIDSITINKNGVYKAKFTTKNIESTQVWFFWTTTSWEDGNSATVKNIIVLEGDHTQEAILFFDGMQSVKTPVLTTTGKNLFDKEAFYNDWKSKEESYVYKEIVDNEEVLKINNFFHLYADEKGFRINVKKGVPLAVSFQCKKAGNETTNAVFTIRYGDKAYASFSMCHSDEWKTVSTTFVPTRDYITFCSGYNNAGYFHVKNIQLEEGSVATEYEPFKSSILMVNEEVELRGVGNVQDELDLSTGEFTQRIGEIVLDGSEDWIISTTKEKTQVFNYKSDIPMKSYNTLISDKFIVGNPGDTEKIVGDEKGSIYIAIDKTIANTSSTFKTWLANNNVLVQYQHATESVKTVDLIVQNQDGGTIPHIQTQQGVTHVSTSSDGLSPMVEMSCSYDTIIKPNTTYTIKLDRPNVSDTMYLQVDLGGTMMMLDADVNAFTIKTPSTLSHSQLRLSGTGNTVKEIIVLEGNRVNDRIEYFEGMKNVENPILVVSSCPYVFGKGGRL